MSDFTIQLRDLCENGWEFPTDWPIYDEGHREVLVKKIVGHYWYDEIGAETVEQFTFFLGQRLREVMPFFNQRYETAALEFDPLNTIDLRSESKTTGTDDDKSNGKTHQDYTSKTSGEETQDSSTDGSTTTQARSVGSEYPQTRLAGNEDYATTGTDSASESETKGSSKSKGTSSSGTTQNSDGTSETVSHSDMLRDMASRTHGRQGNAMDLISKWRELIINVDMEIVESLSDLFMMVWNSNDEYASTGGSYGTYPLFV